MHLEPSAARGRAGGASSFQAPFRPQAIRPQGPTPSTLNLRYSSLTIVPIPPSLSVSAAQALSLSPPQRIGRLLAEARARERAEPEGPRGGGAKGPRSHGVRGLRAQEAEGLRGRQT